MTPIDTSRLLENVDRFYSNAFDHLLTTVVCMVGFIGLVVPLIVGLIQSLSLSVKTKALERKFEERAREMQESIQKQLAEKLTELVSAETAKQEAAFKVVVEKQNQDRDYHKACDFKLQGIRERTDRQYAAAAQSLLDAAFFFVRANCEGDLKRTLTVLNDQVLEHITAEDLKESPVVEKSMQELIDILKAWPRSDAYEDEIELIRGAFVRIKQRQRVAVAKT
jgi:hypothetical protein